MDIEKVKELIVGFAVSRKAKIEGQDRKVWSAVGR